MYIQPFEWEIGNKILKKQRKGFIAPGSKHKECIMEKAIYGLKQASRIWNKKVESTSKDFGFDICHYLVSKNIVLKGCLPFVM